MYYDIKISINCKSVNTFFVKDGGNLFKEREEQYFYVRDVLWGKNRSDDVKIKLQEQYFELYYSSLYIDERWLLAQWQ